MKFFVLTLFLLSFSVLTLSGCTVFANSKIETAPYTVILSAKDNDAIEIREYNNVVLASTSMEGEGRNGAFRRLFKYISGDNIEASKIEMTAPVFMDDGSNKTTGEKIEMTAPVFMDGSENEQDESVMSFVLPTRFTYETAPKPKNVDVFLQKMDGYQVAAIRFNGRLSEENIEKHQKILEEWINQQNFKIIGPYKTAGYNAPFTLPVLRRNEVLIPVALP